MDRLKKLGALMLLSGVFAASAVAQSVSVVLNDGTLKKFGADYIKEMTIQEGEPEAPLLQMDEIALSPYGYGNVTLVMKNTETNTVFSCDLYGPEDAVFLHAGQYPAKENGDSFYMSYNKEYTYVETGDVRKGILSGRVDIANDGPTYTIEAALALEDNSGFRCQYVGKLPRYTPYIEMELAQASYNENPMEKGEFYVKMNDRDWALDMAIDFRADASATVLPAGTYTYSTEKTPGTFSEGSYLNTYSPYAAAKMAEGSTVTVAEEGGVYTLTLDLVLDDGRRAALTYVGAIAGTPSFKGEEVTPDLVYTVSSAAYNSNQPREKGEFYVKMNDQNWTFEMAIDFFADPSATLLPAGTYVYATENKPGTFSSKSYLDIYSPSYAGCKMKEGSVITVTEDGENRTLDMLLLLDDGRLAKVTFTGLIEGTPAFKN